VDVEPLLDDEPASPEPPPLLPPDPDSVPELVVAGASSFFAGDDERPELALDRSFFAQPDPLKWMVGGAKALVIVPSAPQFGQNLGPSSWIPWTTSVRWPQLLQT
jgi:hypothetical protein